MNYVARYHPEIKNCLKKYPHLKDQFKKKKDHILQDPFGLGEPLKGELCGLRSFRLTKNFVIIFLICEECRKLNHQQRNKCSQCGNIPPNSVIFLLFAPHDSAYKKAPYVRDDLEKEI